MSMSSTIIYTKQSTFHFQTLQKKETWELTLYLPKTYNNKLTIDSLKTLKMCNMTQNRPDSSTNSEIVYSDPFPQWILFYKEYASSLKIR